MLCQGRSFLEISIHVFKGTSDNKFKKRIKGNFKRHFLLNFNQRMNVSLIIFFGHSKIIIINIIIIMKFDSVSGIEGVEFEGMERNERRQRK